MLGLCPAGVNFWGNIVARIIRTSLTVNGPPEAEGEGASVKYAPLRRGCGGADHPDLSAPPYLIDIGQLLQAVEQAAELGDIV